MTKRKKVNSCEKFKDVKDFYEVDTDGNLYGYNGRKLSDASYDRDGYLQNNIQLNDGSRKTTKRHQLVANVFIDNPENKKTVNHIDEDKTNNCVENLEWMTQRENANHGTRTERSAQSRSKAVIGTCIKTGEQIEFPSMAEAQRQGFDNSNISSCCLGKRNSHKGYFWNFK